MENCSFSMGGSDHIASLIKEALMNETRTATVSGNWEIDTPVRIPSNFTLILEDCHLKLADSVYCNIFINENNGTDIGKTLSGTDRNINIIGRGKAILDGGNYNGLSEKTQLKDGLPGIWNNNLILFTNVDGFKIEGIACHNQRWWAMNFIYCSNGYVGNIDFQATDTAIDENGNEYHCLSLAKYSDILVKNADGIDLRVGCHDILIENITGFTEDDSVALTALLGRMEDTFAVEGHPTDIYNVTVRNINTAALCSCVRLLNQGGPKLHDIVVDGVYDKGYECPSMDRGFIGVRVGDIHLYGACYPTEGDTYNITIKNVRSCAHYAVSLSCDIENLVMYGIETFDGAKMLLDERK